MSQFHEMDQDLMMEVSSSERAPLTVPAHAVVTGDRARWQEVMHVVDTDYEEREDPNTHEVIGRATIKYRVSDTFSQFPTNAGKFLTNFKRINWSQLQARTNDGQVEMSKISLRQLTQLIMAGGAAKDRNEVKVPGLFLAKNASGNSPLAGAIVQAQIQHGPDKNGEPQQEAQRFVPFKSSGTAAADLPAWTKSV